MNIAALCGITLVSTVVCVLLKKYVPEYSVMAEIAIGIIIMSVVLYEFSPALSEIKSLLSTANIPTEYGQILFKSIGICFLTQFASDSCKDAGERSLATKIELAGKISIIITALPLFEKIIKTAISLMGR